MNEKYKLWSSKNSNTKIFFALFTLLIPFVILVIIEGTLSISGYGDDFNLFNQNSTKGFEDYLQVNPKIGKKYFQNFHFTTPANDTFLKKKEKDSFRIFVMGSSTVFGFPFKRNLMFSRILNARLEEAFPNKNIEVINTSISAINSFTLLDFSDQILKEKPDAVLIYAGHNEFYGAFGVASNETMSRYRILTQIHFQLMDLKIYQLLRNIISTLSKSIGKTKKEDNGTLMKAIVGNKNILLNSNEYQLAMKWYSQNMEDVLLKFHKQNVPVFYSEVVSNYGDLKPFNSYADNGLEAAMDVFKKAEEFERNENYMQAIKYYEYARDLDCVRFRASSEINQIIHNLAMQNNAILVPMVETFQNNSPNRIIGDDLIIDHVHPTIKGQFIMAEAFFNELVNSEIISKNKNPLIGSPSQFKSNYGYSQLDSLLAIHRIGILKSHWPFVLDQVIPSSNNKQYKPNSYLDSLAYIVSQNKNIRLVDVRIKLAKEYETRGLYAEAFREYNALLYTNPYVGINYTDAAYCLLLMSDYEKALRYYQKSLKFENSFYSHFIIGEIYLIMEDYMGAAESFSKAIALAPKTHEVNKFANTYITLINTQQEEYAKKVAGELVKLRISQ